MLLFILVIAGLVQLIEIMLQKLSPKLYQALGIYLPLITTNCAVLGAATINADSNYTVPEATVFGLWLRHRLCAGAAAFLEPARTARPRRSSETVPGNPRSPSSPPESWRWRSSASRDSADGVAT